MNLQTIKGRSHDLVRYGINNGLLRHNAAAPVSRRLLEGRDKAESRRANLLDQVRALEVNGSARFTSQVQDIESLKRSVYGAARTARVQVKVRMDGDGLRVTRIL